MVSKSMGIVVVLPMYLFLKLIGYSYLSVIESKHDYRWEMLISRRSRCVL